MSETLNRILFWILAVFSLAADQSSKYFIFDMLSDPASNHVHSLFQSQQNGGFQLVAQFQYDMETRQMKKDSRGNPIPYVNQGALFGFLGNHQSLANGLFAVISCAAAMAIIFWSSQKGSTIDLALSIALGFILGGTLGNFYDRLVFNGVRDFLHWNYLFDWPVFNLADCWLVGGAILLMLLAFRSPKENSKSSAPPIS
ncbi:MAG: signal peptidase II [Planctomycetes bacterium]|nr:signal peptidase II [Planctomycetota bacterium]